MTNVDATLKRAFIDAQFDAVFVSSHTFSPEFEEQMRRLFKSQKGLMRLINTAGKRAACILLSLLIAAASAVCGVDALREPIVEAIQSFFVNVKEYLTGTRAGNISVYFSDDVTQITATNRITSTPKQYLIDDPEKIAAFTQLLTQTDWALSENDWEAETDYIMYQFDFQAGEKTVTTLRICSLVPDSFGIAEIIQNGKSRVYHISESAYYDILAFTTQKYYLHQSDLTPPVKDLCLAWQCEALSGLNEAERQALCADFRSLHTNIENFLLGRVSLLKEPDSIYWEIFTLNRDEVFTDPFTGTQSIDNSYHILLELSDRIIEVSKNAALTNAVTAIKADLVKAVQNHDIGSIFAVHEQIHDYDYYIVNYPVHYDLAPPDWSGIHKYFGHLADKQ